MGDVLQYRKKPGTAVVAPPPVSIEPRARTSKLLSVTGVLIRANFILFVILTACGAYLGIVPGIFLEVLLLVLVAYIAYRKGRAYKPPRHYTPLAVVRSDTKPEPPDDFRPAA